MSASWTPGPPTAMQAVEAHDKVRLLEKRARDARARSYRRTPGTATAQREWAKADEYLERAEEQRKIVSAFLVAAARGEL